MENRKRAFVAGHRGLVGSALVRELVRRGDYEPIVRTRDELDLRDPAATLSFFERERPEIVLLAAAKVGGIGANIRLPADFIRDNLLIQSSVIEAAHQTRVQRLVFFGSSCIYPRDARQPICETELLRGPLEPTNEAYAVAKIAGIRMVQAYRRQHGHRWICLMPTNLYGPGDNFDLEDAHMVPALIRRFHEAKLARARALTLWGTGTPRRELLHVADLARATFLALDRYDEDGILNVGTGEDATIADIAKLVGQTVGFAGDIDFDTSRPDGVPRKLLDVTRLAAIGFTPSVALRDGLGETYRWYTGALTSDLPRGVAGSACV